MSLDVDDLAGVPPELVEEYRRSLRRHHRLRSLEVLWAWSSLRRVRGCGRRTTGGMVQIGTADGIASVRGVQRCASIHACPWCSPKIRQGRADEINEAGAKHLAAGGGLLFLTLTLPHVQTDRLGALWGAVAGSWSGLADSHTWRSWGALWGLDVSGNGRRRLGAVRSLEVTYGSNGWHPHLHVLVFTDRPMPVEDQKLFAKEVWREWRSQVTSRGFDAPTRRRGVDVQPVRTLGELGGYLAGLDGTRVDLELARGDLKRGKRSRSPWQILGDVAKWGDHADLSLWWEYENASHGKNAITWSHGLKRFFGIGAKTDDELAEDEVGLDVKVTLGAANWHKVIKAKVLSPLLTAVERDDKRLVVEVLDRAGVHWSMVWWGEGPSEAPPPPYLEQLRLVDGDY